MTISISDLAFGYPDRLIGNGLNLTVCPGEVLCLLGPNGCGKTTLFKTILRLLKLRGGTISIDGEATDRWSQRKLARKLSYVPQQHDITLSFTVIEVVLMGRSAHIGTFSQPMRHDRAIAVNALQSMRIDHLKEAIFTEISGGERQLTLIARALAQETKIVIMDEPTANLDFGNQVLVLNSIRRLAQSGISILMSSHNPDHAFQVASRVATMRNGSLTGLGKPLATITQDSLRDLYGVEVTIVELQTDKRHSSVLCVPMLE